MMLAFKIGDIIKVPFGWLLNFLYEFTNSYGLALILFAFLVKLVLMPATAKAKKSSMKMSRISPQIKDLQEKYKDDPQRQNAEVQALYKREGVSLGGSCLWSLLPLLILIPLYQVMRQPIQYMLGETAELATKICQALGFDNKDGVAEISAAAKIYAESGVHTQMLTELGAKADTMKGLNFYWLGINLGATPAYNIFNSAVWKWDWAHIGAFLIPVLSSASQVVSMLVSQKLNNSVITDENGIVDKEAAENSQANQQGKMMMWVMPLMSLWIGFSMPAALSLYWLVQGVASLVGDIYLTKHYRKIYDAEDAVKLAKLQESEALEAEKERIRAERRAANPEGITTNTSKKKIQAAKQAEKEAEKAAAAKEYAAKKSGEAVEETPDKENTAPSGIASRPNCKGRNYDPNRYKEN